MIVCLTNSMKLHLALHVEGGGIVCCLSGGEGYPGLVRPAVAECKGRELVLVPVLEGNGDCCLSFEVLHKLLPHLGHEAADHCAEENKPEEGAEIQFHVQAFKVTFSA